MAAAVLMELMEAILLDGVVHLGNHSIYFYIPSIITNLFFKFPYSSLYVFVKRLLPIIFYSMHNQH